MRAAIVRQQLDPSVLVREVASETSGATVLFVGTVREVNDGRAVTGIDYSAYETMALRELNAIATEAADHFGTPNVVVEHRLGTLELGDASVAIAVSHARRAPAIDAARYVIEEIKKRVPIWKREHYADGTREWVDPTAQARAGTSAVGARANSSGPEEGVSVALGGSPPSSKSTALSAPAPHPSTASLGEETHPSSSAAPRDVALPRGR